VPLRLQGRISVDPMKVKGYLTYRASIGEQVIPLDSGSPLTLRDLLARLARDSSLGDFLLHAESNTGRPDVIILLNGRHLSSLPSGLDTLLQEEDELAIFPPLAGG